jgi:hypothetical protein
MACIDKLTLEIQLSGLRMNEVAGFPRGPYIKWVISRTLYVQKCDPSIICDSKDHYTLYT